MKSHKINRKYRIRRPARIAAVVIALMIILTVPGVFYAQGRTDAERSIQDVIAVQPGDTLWGIASKYTRPGEDVRVVVEQIRLHNNLKSLILHPGQTIEIPTF